MPLTNSRASYGAVTKTFHWLTALLILTAIPLGLYANALPYGTGEALAWKAQIFSAHKTLGIAAFTVGVARIAWALTQTKPALLHPEARVQAFLAETVHWLLYASLVLVPLTGWVHHAATSGFAPIWWPFGQSLPFVPKSDGVAQIAAAAHWLFTKIIAVSILLHIAGALKHHLIDRDNTLRRMLPGSTAVAAPPRVERGLPPALAALGIYVAGGAAAFAISASAPPTTAAVPAGEPAAVAEPAAGGWRVQSGTLTFSVRQMGTPVSGSFADWAADISFAEEPVDGVHGTVIVRIAVPSLTLGSVTEQAKTAEFFDAAAFPAATFTATIRAADTGYLADGTLTLKGASMPVQLPFTLVITGDTAEMTGQAVLDRRAFGIGPSYPDEASVGFAVSVDVVLTATRG